VTNTGALAGDEVTQLYISRAGTTSEVGRSNPKRRPSTSIDLG
jgi:hypothetical protein